MYQPKAGDVVTYSAFGRKMNAIVLVVRSGETSHLGSDGEPLLTVAFIDPARETGVSPNQIGHIPQIVIEHDVVHASHEFSEEFKRDKGIQSPAQIASLRGHGEWLEGATDDIVADSLRDQLWATRSNLSMERANVRTEKARADLATTIADELKKQLDSVTKDSKAEPANDVHESELLAATNELNEQLGEAANDTPQS